MEPLVAAVRIVHALYAAFVCMTPALRGCGVLLRSRALTAPTLGRLHLAGLAFATLQLAFGWSCPLTRLEARLAGRPADSFLIPESWTDASALPPWVWPALALAWAACLWTERAVGGYHRRSEATCSSGSVSSSWR